MKISTDGIVIWETKTNEADRVITLLTPGGVISAYAKSSLRPSSKLTTPTSMLTYSDFELFSGKNMYTVDDAMTKQRFMRLFSDMVGNAYATYFCELTKLLAPVDDDSKEYLSLLLNSLYLLNEQKKDRNLIKNVFELRIMSYAGYMPDLVACLECGCYESDVLYFDVLSGGWICKSCAAKHGRQPNCSASVLAAMRHIIYSQPNKAFSIALGASTAENLKQICESYVVSHIERPLKTLDFLSVIK